MSRANQKIVLLAGLLPTLALADVTLYGQIRGGIEGNKVRYQGGEGSTTNVRDYSSRLGFKGSEALDNGLTAIWQVEQSVSTQGNTTTGWSNRTTFVGLEGPWGKVRIGNLDNYANSDLDIVDAWAYRNPALGLALYTRYSGRTGSTIRYDSADLGGFSGSLLYANSDDRNTPNETAGLNVADNTDAALYGLGLFYGQGPYFVGYAYSLDKKGYEDANGADKDTERHRLETGYREGRSLLAVGYEYGRGVDQFLHTLVGSRADAEEKVRSQQVVVTGQYGLGGWVPKVTYAHGFKQKIEGGDKIDNGQYNQFILGTDYYLSSRTRLMATAGWLQSGKGDTRYRQTATSLGMRHHF